MANNNITVKVYGNATSNAGFNPISLLNSTSTTKWEPQYVVPTGVGTNSRCFTIQATASDIIYTLVLSNVSSAGASRKGLLKIAFSLPASMMLDNERSPHDLLLDLEDAFVGGYMIKQNDGSLQFKENIDGGVVNSTLQAVIDRYNTTQRRGKYNTMSGSEAAVVECSDEGKQRQLLKEVYQYKEFVSFAELVVASQVERGSYGSRDLTSKIKIPRPVEYKIVAWGKEVPFPESGRIIISPQKYNNKFKPECHEETPIKFNVQDVINGKLPTGVSFDAVNETIVCEAPLVDKTQELTITVNQIPKNAEIKVRVGRKVIPIKETLKTVTLKGDEIAEDVTVEHNMSNNIVRGGNKLSKKVTDGGSKATVQLEIVKKEESITRRNSVSDVMPRSDKEYQIVIKDIPDKVRDSIVRVEKAFSSSNPRSMLDWDVKGSSKELRIPQGWCKENEELLISFPRLGYQYTCRLHEGENTIFFSNFNIGKKRLPGWLKPILLIVGGLLVGLAIGFVIGRAVSPKGSEKPKAPVQKVDVNDGKDTPRHETPTVEDNKVKQLESYAEELKATDLKFAQIDEMYDFFKANDRFVFEKNSDFANRIEEYHKLADTVRYGQDNVNYFSYPYNNPKIYSQHLKMINESLARSVKNDPIGNKKANLYAQKHKEIKSFEDFTNLIYNPIEKPAAPKPQPPTKSGLGVGGL